MKQPTPLNQPAPITICTFRPNEIAYVTAEAAFGLVRGVDTRDRNDIRVRVLTPKKEHIYPLTELEPVSLGRLGHRKNGGSKISHLSVVTIENDRVFGAKQSEGFTSQWELDVIPFLQGLKKSSDQRFDFIVEEP